MVTETKLSLQNRIRLLWWSLLPIYRNRFYLFFAYGFTTLYIIFFGFGLAQSLSDLPETQRSLAYQSLSAGMLAQALIVSLATGLITIILDLIFQTTRLRIYLRFTKLKTTDILFIYTVRILIIGGIQVVAMTVASVILFPLIGLEKVYVYRWDLFLAGVFLMLFLFSFVGYLVGSIFAQIGQARNIFQISFAVGFFVMLLPILQFYKAFPLEWVVFSPPNLAVNLVSLALLDLSNSTTVTTLKSRKTYYLEGINDVQVLFALGWIFLFIVGMLLALRWMIYSKRNRLISETEFLPRV